MQQLARELNFSETTFVLPPRDPSHTCRVRIFSPNQELPFAGHPTVGTAAVLASLAEGDFAERQLVFDWDISKETLDPEVRLNPRNRAPIDYMITATRSLVSDEDTVGECRIVRHPP